jgi:histidine triad (HIT) family protein
MLQMNYRKPPLPSDAALVKISNVFEQILAGSAEASFVYRDDKVAVFMDIQPLNPGRVLVVPLEPARFLCELNDETAAHMFVIGKRVAEAIRCTTLECEGVHFFLADGVAAGQEIPHVHLHVVPRHGKDGFGLNLPERYFKLPPRSALEAAAQSIKEALKSAV